MADTRQAQLLALIVAGSMHVTGACSDADRGDVTQAAQGTFSLVTYNVAGLPEGISGSRPAQNTPLISPLLNDYDVVLVQEDFAYHDLLVSSAEQPYQSVPDSTQAGLGDGLNILSSFPITSVLRTRWSDCSGTLDSGSDCLTPKGFFLTQVEVSAGAFIDVYNLHADAGRAAPDAQARAANLAQVQEAIEANSEGHAVIVAGDFNERYSYADETVSNLLVQASLKDVWVELERDSILPPSPSDTAPECATDNANLSCERIDKILYRSGPTIDLTPVGYRVDSALFVDESGLALSDHPPVVAVFDFVAR